MQNENGIFNKQISIRWSDLDANFHVRHSVYYDFGAQQRLDILNSLGLTIDVMKEGNFGPVLLREECVFRREIRLNDRVIITAKLARLSADGSRWTIIHEFLGAGETLLATLTVDGGWIDTNLRKFVPSTPQIVKEVFEGIPRSESFVQA
ncbi:MAG TPA: acyl-CoA thioesterase [Flavitalea sp.]|nr:acyl-CoA thioesterase [Flavitalea sp.]